MKIVINLRARVVATLSLLVLVSLVGGGTMIWYTYRVETMVREVLDHNIAAYQAAEALEIALVNQKGFVSYYVMDKDPAWLRQLGEWRQTFKARLAQIRDRETTPEAADILTRIDRRYNAYVTDKDVVLDHYSRGDQDAGIDLHQKLREEFFAILALCEDYKAHQDREISRARSNSSRETARLRKMTVTALLIQVGAGLFLGAMLIGQVLEPLRILTMKTERRRGDHPPMDLVKALTDNVEHLLRDAGQAHEELEKSRENLVMAEKMAMVGKLAAGMAHSVRNPLTSVKMRLFSLNRSLSLDEDQAEDLMVISEEIQHIDTIVQNFLEFSRPPRLQMQRISPSTVVDMTLQLLTHRLKSYDVTVRLERDAVLPDIKADPEQLKEVFVNLIENACQAMGRGGMITIREKRADTGPEPRACVLTFRDNGPGMTAHALEKAFLPFFTTKEDGTGLGLSIAERIIDNHGGAIRVDSLPGEGATFTIILPPFTETTKENRS
ncbi:hypothetical protein JCM14469_01370 [Desulfatiferula olefinivorans]